MNAHKNKKKKQKHKKTHTKNDSLNIVYQITAKFTHSFTNFFDLCGTPALWVTSWFWFALGGEKGGRMITPSRLSNLPRPECVLTPISDSLVERRPRRHDVGGGGVLGGWGGGGGGGGAPPTHGRLLSANTQRKKLFDTAREHFLLLILAKVLSPCREFA